MKRAQQPFRFVCASYLTRISLERAWTLAELEQHLRSVSAGSIFYHTFQSLEAHHYTIFANDFAHWVMAGCNEATLAEELGAIDLRDFVSVEELRKVLVHVMESHLEKMPQSADRPAFEPFYFCEAVEIAVPLGTEANTLAELAEGVRQMSLRTFHYHFINSRLRLQLRTNDFSLWIHGNLELPNLADQLNRMDFYTNTLEGVREEVLQLLEAWETR